MKYMILWESKKVLGNKMSVVKLLNGNYQIRSFISYPEIDEIEECDVQVSKKELINIYNNLEKFIKELE